MPRGASGIEKGVLTGVTGVGGGLQEDQVALYPIEFTLFMRPDSVRIVTRRSK